MFALQEKIPGLALSWPGPQDYTPTSCLSPNLVMVSRTSGSNSAFTTTASLSGLSSTSSNWKRSFWEGEREREMEIERKSVGGATLCRLSILCRPPLSSVTLAPQIQSGRCSRPHLRHTLGTDPSRLGGDRRREQTRSHTVPPIRRGWSEGNRWRTLW